MAAHGDPLAPVYGNRDDAAVSSQVTLSADTAPFFPARYSSCAFPASDTEKQFFRCTEKLRCLRPDSERLREELNLLFDQLLSESYNLSNEPSKNIQPEVKHTSLGFVSTIVALQLNIKRIVTLHLRARTVTEVGAVTWHHQHQQAAKSN